MADNAKKNSKKSIVAQAEAKAEKMLKDKEKSKSKGGKKQNGLVKYFKDLRSEFKKVVWPSKKKVINNTLVVLTGMCASAIVIWGIDSALTALVKLGLGS